MAYSTTEKQANQLADKLIEKCEKEVGGKWEKDVWENLGWCYCVSLKDGDITIWEHEYKSKPYCTVAGYRGGTPVQISTRKSSNSIKVLVKEQLKEVQQEADKWNDYLERNKSALKKK